MLLVVSSLPLRGVGEIHRSHEGGLPAARCTRLMPGLVCETAGKLGSNAASGKYTMWSATSSGTVQCPNTQRMACTGAEIVHGICRRTATARAKKRTARRLRGVFVLTLLCVGTASCREDGEKKQPGSAATDVVTLYCSVDEAFAHDIIEHYQATTGDRVQAVFDSEAGKTTGLVNRIIHEAEAGRPRADVFWSGELFNTILLARRGLLGKYDTPAAMDIPPRFRDPQRRWTAMAVRGRVIAFRSESKAKGSIPTKWEDLARPPFASQTAIANPLFGTTRGHIAAMFALWGGERGRAFLTGLRDHGAQVVDGNSTAVRMLIAGNCAYAATDTDDVWVAQNREAQTTDGVSIDFRYLDMGDGGTLLIPCSVAVVQGGPHPVAARQLVDYLVSAEVERALARSRSRNVPVRKSLREELGMDWPAESKVTFDAIADAMDEAVAASREILIR